MLLQNEDIGDTFDSMFWHLKIRCTTACNMHCAHCYAASEDYQYEPPALENFEWAERLIKSDHVRFVHLQGGEPTLAFDTMKECRCIGAQYGKPVCVFTNGKLLYEDQQYRERFDREICPDMLIVSFNRYLEKQTDQAEVVNTLATHYKDHPTIKFGSTAMIYDDNQEAMYNFISKDHGWPPYDPKYFKEIEDKLLYDYWKFQLPLCNSSRAVTSGAGEDAPKVYWEHGLACDFSTVLMPSGFLQADCGCGSVEKTTLGHIDDFGEDPMQYLFDNRESHYVSNITKPMSDFYEICMKRKSCHCLSKYPPRTRPDNEYERRWENELL